PLMRAVHPVARLAFQHAAATQNYTLPLHDALPIFAAQVKGNLARARAVLPPDAMRDLERAVEAARARGLPTEPLVDKALEGAAKDRKSTRLNSSHVKISYAVFCLKKKKSPPCRRGS